MCVHACVCALRIASRDKIFRFKNTLIIMIQGFFSPIGRHKCGFSVFIHNNGNWNLKQSFVIEGQMPEDYTGYRVARSYYDRFVDLLSLD